MRFCFIFTFISLIGYNDSLTLKPSFELAFDLQPDTIHEKLKMNELVDSLYKIKNPSDSIKLFLNSLDLDQQEGINPFSTAPIGCSWYCGAGPDSIYGFTLKDSLFKVENIHDMNLSSSLKGKVDSNSIAINFKLSKTLNANSIYIYNGDCSSLSNWENRARAKTIKLTINDTLDIRLELNDSYNGQVFELKQLIPKDQRLIKFNFTVNEVYPGLKEKETFYISEINFDGIGAH